MNNFLTQVLNILITSPGNLIYHLVLAFAVIAVLQSALAQLRTTNAIQAKRMTIGLVLLLVAQVTGFLVSGLAWQGLIDPAVVLPVLDRVLTALSLIFILWIWAFPEPLRWADTLVVFLALVTAIAGAFSLGLWAPDAAGVAFNGTWLESAWELYSLALVLIGVVMLLVGRPTAWATGLAMLLVLLAGLLGHILYPLAGNFAAAMRLAQLVAYPLLLALPQRFQAAAVEVPPAATEPRKPGQERRRYSADPKTVLALLQLANEDQPGATVESAARAIAQAMLADLCLLVSVPNRAHDMSIMGGYDLIREERIEGRALPKDMAPMLANAIQRSKPLKLQATHTASPDLKTLADMLGLTGGFNLLAVPMIGANDLPLGGIVLLSPYSNRAWNNEDQAYLANTADALALILTRTQRFADQFEQTQQMNLSLQAAQETIEQMQSDQESLTRQVEILSQQTGSGDLAAAQANAQDIITALRDENQSLREALAAGGSTSHEQLNQMLEEMSQLQNALAEANTRLQQNQPAGETGSVTQDQADALALMLQELRQPVSAILTQVETLKQTDDQPGSTQRKAAERIAAASERLHALVDEMSGVLNEVRGLQPADEADLVMLIDNAIADTGAQMREKNIALRVDLPESLPNIKADPDALQQVIVYLLRNAGAVTPPGGAIRLKARLQDGTSINDYLLLQVTDSGGGVSAKDLPRLFSQIEMDANTDIPGIGSAYELGIARSLVEAMQGRMLVDAQEGKSTTVSVLLPVAQQAALDLGLGS